MPDGYDVKLSSSNEAKLLPERLFFDPKAVESGQITHTVQQACQKAILATDRDLQLVMAKNIVLAGGSTLYRGFGERLRSKLLESNLPVS